MKKCILKTECRIILIINNIKRLDIVRKTHLVWVPTSTEHEAMAIYGRLSRIERWTTKSSSSANKIFKQRFLNIFFVFEAYTSKLQRSF